MILSQKQRSHLRILRSCSSRLVRSSPVRRLRNPENFSALRLRSEARFVRSYPESRLISSARGMVGKKVMVVTNLKPAKLAGILSEGMILCAEDADGNLSLMVPEKEMPAGAEI